MTITSVGNGGRSAGGTTTTVVPYPASGIVAGDLAVSGRTIKPDSATGTAEAGWSQRVSATGGTGAQAADTGPTRIVVDTRELAGTENGTSVTFDNAATPNSTVGFMMVYRRSGNRWEIVVTSGTDNTHGTGRSVTGAAALDLAPGDLVVVFLASDTDTATAFSGQAITAPGITFGATTTRIGAGGVTTGNQSGISCWDATVAAASAAAVAVPSFSVSAGPSSCGPVGFIRLRELNIRPRRPRPSFRR
jgi:hypothetical protein